MPQIANQDYTVIAPAYADYVQADAHAQSLLAQQIKRGTIFDCLIFRPGENDANVESYGRVVSMRQLEKSFELFVFGGNLVCTITMMKNENYNSALEEIQLAVELKTNTPFPTAQTTFGEKLFYEAYTHKYLCVNDKYVKIIIANEDYIGGYEITDITPEDGVAYANISKDALDKLIGWAVY